MLEHNGEVFAGPVERAPEYGDEAQGCWVPKTKTWEDLGIDIPEPPDTEEASDIGPVKAAEYLPFLKRFRTIVEDMRSDIPNKRAQLIALKDEDDHSPTIWERLCVSYPDFPNSYFYHEFTLIPAIGMKTAKALFDSGIRTIGELSACSQEALSKVPGVGSRAARAVAAHFHNESESATS